MLHSIPVGLCLALALTAAEPVRLTTDGRLKQDLVFPPGGEFLVFTEYESPTLMSLMRLKLADGSIERLHPKAATNEFELAFSRDGRYEVFVQNRANLNLKLVIRDTKENKDAVYDPGGGFSGMRHPTFARDSSRVVFSMPAPGGQQLLSVNLAAEDKKVLTSWAGITNWPGFSPDGQRLVFGSSQDGDFEIYTSAADLSDVKRLTQSAGRDQRPRWSPDGKRLSFTSARDGNDEIYVMQADGSGVKRLTNHAERDDYSAWHPDGRRLAIVSERQGKVDVYLIDVE